MNKTEMKTLLNAKNLLTQLELIPTNTYFTAKDLKNVHGATLAYWCDMGGYKFSHTEKMWVQVNEDTILRKDIKVYVKTSKSSLEVYKRKITNKKIAMAHKIDRLNLEIAKTMQEIEMLENF